MAGYLESSIFLADINNERDVGYSFNWLTLETQQGFIEQDRRVCAEFGRIEPSGNDSIRRRYHHDSQGICGSFRCVSKMVCWCLYSGLDLMMRIWPSSIWKTAPCSKKFVRGLVSTLVANRTDPRTGSVLRSSIVAEHWISCRFPGNIWFEFLATLTVDRVC